MNDGLLHIYLNDHLAGSVLGLELAERCLASNPDGDLGVYLRVLLVELREDQAVLRDVLARVGGHKNVAKEAGAWLAEKLGRLKLNGSLLEYSPLSRVVELEGLALGVTGREALWDALGLLRETDPRLGGFDFAPLSARAREEQAQIEAHRLAAVRTAFAPETHVA